MVQVALFVAAMLSLLFALMVFMNDVRSSLFRLYLLFGVTSVLWMSVNAVVVEGSMLTVPSDVHFWFAQLITPTALATSLTFCMFLRYFAKRRFGRVMIIPVAASIVVSLFSFTSFNVYLGSDGAIMLGGLYPYYLAALLLNIACVFHSLYTVHASDSTMRMQLHYLRWGAVAAIIPTILFGAVLPIFADTVLGDISPLFSILFLVFAGVAIAKYSLFDIKLAAVRSIVYALLLLTMTCIYFALAYVVSLVLFRDHVSTDVSLNPVNVILALILALVFQPLKRFFDKVTNDIFYHDTYSSDAFFAKFSSLLVSTTDLRGLLTRASGEIAETFKAEQAFFHLQYTNKTEHHMSSGTTGHTTVPLYDVQMLDKYANDMKSAVILTDMLTERDENMRRMLRSHKIALAMPLLRGTEIMGYLFLGNHRSARYTKQDIKVLTTTRNELIIAIQNALSLHEVQELNETLQQRINVATKELRSSNSQLKHLDEVKDEFMSMASHQLRTPLTSIKGYLSMVLEGDAGHISPQQRKLLEEAYKSSERMVGLIADFLNVSRLQTGKFVLDRTPFDFKDVVRQEVADLQLIANTHDIKLRAKLGVGAFPVVADEQKLRQVIMNLIDNAIYYSPPKSTVVVNLERIKNHAALTVVDPGIGVPEAEQSRLFNKFFRAHNARKQRPDGTGVGLYLARRVVTAHGGGIIFSSKENRGSTFGFRIPIDETAVIKPRRSQAAAAKTTK